MAPFVFASSFCNRALLLLLLLWCGFERGVAVYESTESLRSWLALDASSSAQGQSAWSESLRQRCEGSPHCRSVIYTEEREAFHSVVAALGIAQESSVSAVDILDALQRNRVQGKAPYCGAEQMVSAMQNGLLFCICRGDGSPSIFSSKDVMDSCNARKVDAVSSTILFAITVSVVLQSLSAMVALSASTPQKVKTP